MAALAVDRVGGAVVKLRRFPGAGVVAGRALRREVIGGFVAVVAGDTIGGVGQPVVEFCRFPAFGAVTARALTRKMVDGFVFAVAVLAVNCFHGHVIELGWFPGVCAVAQVAVAFKVLDRGLIGMAGGAVFRGAGIFSIDMAGGALDAEMFAGQWEEGVHGPARARLELDRVGG